MKKHWQGLTVEACHTWGTLPRLKLDYVACLVLVDI